jgi:hypothetical protein
MLLGGSQSKGWMVLGLFAVVALVLLPVCPSSLPEGPSSGCHSDSSSEMPDIPAQQQQPCCWTGSHHQPGIPSAGPLISLVALATFAEAGESLAPQPRLFSELANLVRGSSPPLKTVLRV